MILPCKHDEHITKQVQPTIELLSNLEELHPDVLLQHAIQPTDYKSGMVFRSAVESIRGSFIASSVTGRQGLVQDVLENLYQRQYIAGYEQTSSQARYDFTISIRRTPDYFVALEVKGGEGNSINISERPMWAREFAVWSHLDGAIVNQPAHGAHSIVNRLTNELVRRGKLVDALFFKDVLCGTRARPCPKYDDRACAVGLSAAPDIFLFPQRAPSLEEPDPPVHTLETLRLPQLILSLFGVSPEDFYRHVWQVGVRLETFKGDRLRRVVQVMHEGTVIDESVSRSWRRER